MGVGPRRPAAVASARARRGAAPPRIPRPARPRAAPGRARCRCREPDGGDAALRTRRHACGRTLRDVEQEALGPPHGYTARAPTADDAPGVAELLREAELRDFGQAEADAVELARDWETFDLDRDAVVVCHDDGAAAGYGYFFRRGVEQAIIDVYVHPAHTGRGVGTYLVAELEPRSGDVDRIGSGIPASNAAGRTLLEERGYRMVRRFWRMTIELDRHPPAPVWPEGTLPTRYLPRDEHAIWAAVEEAFEDHWEYRPEP